MTITATVHRELRFITKTHVRVSVPLSENVHVKEDMKGVT